MKRVLTLLSAIILVTVSSTALATMSISKVRKNARFLSDRMAYELNLSPAQYNDIYEINYDFIYSVRHVMDDVVRGYDPAIDRYYYHLDMRNEDLRWVLSRTQYNRFMATQAFYRPVYTSGSSWNFRVYITYHNHNYFYFGKPTHYRTYAGRPAPAPGHASHYRNKYNHTVYNGKVTVNNRRSDFHVPPGKNSKPATTTNTRRTVTSGSSSAAKSKDNKVNNNTGRTTRGVSNGSATTTGQDNKKSTEKTTGTSVRRSSAGNSSSGSSRSSSVNRSSSSSDSGSSSSTGSSSRRSSGTTSTTSSRR